MTMAYEMNSRWYRSNDSPAQDNKRGKGERLVAQIYDVSEEEHHGKHPKCEYDNIKPADANLGPW